MAFETLGVNLTASGIRTVAGDVAHLASSFIKYVDAVKQAGDASVRTAQSQSKLADTMANKAQKNVTSLSNQYSKLITRANTLKVTIDALNLTMRDPVAAKTNYDKAILDVQAYTNAIKQLESTIRYTKKGTVYKQDQWMVTALADLKAKLAGANAELMKQARNYAASMREQDRLSRATRGYVDALNSAVDVLSSLEDAHQDSADAAAKAADKHQELADAQNALTSQSYGMETAIDAAIGLFNDSSTSASGFTAIIAKLVPSLASVAGGMGQTSGASAALASALGISVGALTGIGVAIGAAVIAFKAIQVAINLTIKVVQVAWQVFKKLVAIAWDLAKAIGQTLWSALKKIASAPFKLIASMFGGVGGSMQRVMEMAIGMNLSRVWWQLGMKIRDSFKVATDAAIDYQVTFTRLRSLMVNESIGLLGQGASVDERTEAIKRAVLATEELVKWTSKLAVSTIFNAEDILSIYTLAMSYSFTSGKAKELTESVLDFASGMGLGDVEMRRIIENFGQLRAQGKITGTELRDLARGAFVPVNDVLEEMAKKAGLVGDYLVPNFQEISNVLANMRDNGELTADAFDAISAKLQKLGADGKVTRQEFDILVQDLSQSDVMKQFGLTAEQAGKALEGIKTGALTAELNELIKTGELTIDEFFEAFIEMAENRFPNAARSMGLSMKAVKSNIQDYIATMFGWRLIAPVFEVVAKHVQNFIQSSLMNDQQIALFDKMGKAFKVVTELLLTYSDAMKRARLISGTFFSSAPLVQLKKFTKEFMSIIGSLGTEDFDKQMGLFSFALKSIDLSFDSRNTVTAGIKSLNKIMQDIMAGAEIDPTELKKSMDDVFGTLWKEFFGPKIKESLETAWDNYIKPAIGKLWERMKTEFGKWKEETLLPGIKTFFGTTLPGWISATSKWLAENGPQIIANLGTFVSDILTVFEGLASQNFGADHPLTLLVGLLKDIAIYGTTKIVDPTSDINKRNLDNVSASFGTLKDTLIGISTATFYNLEPVQDFISSWNSPETQENLATIDSFVQTLTDIGLVNSAPLEAIASVLGEIFNGDGEKGADGNAIFKKIEFFEKLYSALGVLTGVPATAVTGVVALFDGILKFIQTISLYKWDSQSTILDNIKEFFQLFGQNWASGGAVEAFGTAVDKIVGFVEKIFGIDTGKFRTAVRNLVDGMREFLGADPIDWPPIVVEQKFEFVPPTTDNPNYTFNTATGKWEYTPPPVEEAEVVVPVKTKVVATVSKYEGPSGFYVDSNGNLQYVTTGEYVYASEPIQVLIQPEIKIQPKSVGGKPTSKKDLIDGWLAGDWGKTTEPFAIEESISVPIQFDIEGGAEASISNLAGTVTAALGGLEPFEMPAPILNAEGMAAIPTAISETVESVASVLSNDTTVAAGGTAMIGALDAAVVAAAPAVVTSVETLATDTQAEVNGMAGSFQDAGANAVLGLRMGMEGQMNSLLAWWEIQVMKLNNIMPNLNDQNSPSRLYRGYGVDMMKGLQNGIKLGVGDVYDEMRKASIGLRQTFGASQPQTMAPQQYTNVSNTNNWSMNITTPLVASTPVQAYEILRMRAR